MRLWLIRCMSASLFALAVGCGGETEPPAAQPAEDEPIFVQGDFGEIPIHPLAEEAGERSEEDGVVAQSFEIRNTSRDALFSWYDERLEGWTQEEAPHALGEAENASFRARWTRGDRRLIITVSEAPRTATDGGTGPDLVLQYSLSLEPIDRPIPDPGPDPSPDNSAG